MRMRLDVHLVWMGHLEQNSLPPVTQHAQLRQKEGSSHCWLPSETNRGPNMLNRSDPWDLGEECCLPVVWVRHISKKFPGLLWPTDYYLLLIFQVGSIKKASDNQERHQDIGIIGPGAHIVFSSELPFHILTLHVLFKASFQQPPEFKKWSVMLRVCCATQHTVILTCIK